MGSEQKSAGTDKLSTKLILLLPRLELLLTRYHYLSWRIYSSSTAVFHRWASPAGDRSDCKNGERLRSLFLSTGLSPLLASVTPASNEASPAGGAVYTLYESQNGAFETTVYSVTRQTWQETLYSFTTSRSVGGSYRYRVTVCNPQVSCTGSSSVYQTVIALNSAPIANADSIMLNQGSTVYINVVGNDWDAEGQTLTPVLYNLPAHGSTAIVNNHVRYTPYGNYYGTDSFTYWAQDTQGAYSGLTQVSLTINAVILTPAKPTITLVNAATGRLTLSWAAQANASKYTLQEAFCGTSCNSLTWQTLASNTSALTLNRTVNSGGIWAYRILACTSNYICSGYSDMATSQINRIPVVFIHSDLLGTPVAHTNEAGDLL